MNEYIEIRFFKNGKRLKVKRQVSGGLEFDERDPIERTVGIGFTHRNEATRLRLDNIRRIQGWPPGQFDLKMSVEDGSIILRGVNPHALPEGFYKVRVQIEEVKNAGGWASANVPHDESAVVDIDLTMDERSVTVDLATCDELVGSVLAQSTVEGMNGTAWVEDDSRRATRRACLLNLLASLRVRPRLGDPLLGRVDHVFRVANDRIYARVDKAFLQTLKDLAKDDSKPFYEEGTPH